MDVYEAQLLAVYAAHADSAGLLDRAALARLCAALQLDPGAAGRLAASARPGRLTFPRFRDALLAVLGAGAGAAPGSGPAPGPGLAPGPGPTLGHGQDEPGREVSPKFVYGSKKYGRRSRPRDAAAASPEPGGSDADAPGEDRGPGAGTSPRREDEIPVELDHARPIDRDEAAALCRRMRVGNVDDDVLTRIFEEREPRSGESMTVGEFFHSLNRKLIDSINTERECVAGERSRDATVDATGAIASNDIVSVDAVVELWERAGVGHCRQMLYDLGFTGEVLVLAELTTVLDEEIKSMLSAADNERETSLPSLLLQASLSLHRYELKCIKETMEQVFAENQKMKADLLESNQRAQVLAQEVDDNHAKLENSLRSKIKHLELKHGELMKETMARWTHDKEQAHCAITQLEGRIGTLEDEEGKLKTRCMSLERNNEQIEKQLTTSQEHVHELERVKLQLTREIKNLALEKSKLNEPSEEQITEVDNLSNQISNLKVENKSLRDRNDELCAEIDDLHEKLTREKRRLSLTRSKPQCDVDISSEQAVSLLEECEAGDDIVWDLALDIRNAIKRRGDSPSKGHYALFEDESPRIGKLRKCHQKKHKEEGAVKSSTSESGLDCDLDSCSDGGSLGLEALVVTQQNDQDDKENDTKENYSKMASTAKTINIIKEIFETAQWTNDCKSCNTLKGILPMIQEINKPSTTTLDNKEHCMAQDTVELLQKSSEAQMVEQNINNLSKIAEDLKLELENERLRHVEEKTKLQNTIKEYELSLEQLKQEYDKCEDYWSHKLEEERDIFNEEQKISDEKFTDLLSKISEYEEQFSPRAKKSSSLPTIDEKGSLELQFTDLEEEYERYKKDKTTEIDDKNKEILLLKEQINHLEETKINNLVVDKISDLGSVDTNFCKSSTVNIISNVEELEDDPIPQDTSPIGYLWNQSTIQSPIKAENNKRETTRDYQNPAFATCKTSSQHENEDRSSSDNERESSSLNPIKKPVLPKRCNSADLLNNPSCGVETRAYNPWAQSKRSGAMIQCAELEGQLRRNAQQSQDCSGSWSNESGGRCGAEVACLMLEQRCRQLQATLRQHQLYLDSIQQTTRTESTLLRQKLYSAESAIAKLQQRLTSADLLVKELYVENCQLTARKPTLL